YFGQKIQAKDVPAHYQNSPILFDHYLPSIWAKKKKKQLRDRLGLVSYIVAFIVLHRQGYRIVQYSGWFYMLKWLSNLEYYHIKEHYNNGRVIFIKSSEYVRIDYFNSGDFYFQEKDVNIDFSDLNNNC
ncbi:995_t:CDS:1, partial [Dentiscutata erythropus]